MGKLMKASLLSSLKALRQAGIDCPDAIITGTSLGCWENTEALLTQIEEEGEVMLSPTNFMQSTHNTIGSLIAIQLGCHGYNATYSHKGNSFQSALQDAWMQISLGDIDTALVGWFDEDFPPVGSSDKAISVVLTASPEGAMGTYEDLLGTLLES